LQCIAVCCSVLQCVAVCCSVLRCVAVCCSVLQCVEVHFSAWPKLSQETHVYEKRHTKETCICEERPAKETYIYWKTNYNQNSNEKIYNPTKNERHCRSIGCHLQKSPASAKKDLQQRLTYITRHLQIRLICIFCSFICAIYRAPETYI